MRLLSPTRPLPALALAALVGCSGSSTLSADALAGTTWAEVCPGSNPERSFLRLDADGTFAWNYDDPDGVTPGDGETWSVDGSTLSISWSDGFAVTAYDLSRLEDGRIPGESTKSCGDEARLERL